MLQILQLLPPVEVKDLVDIHAQAINLCHVLKHINVIDHNVILLGNIVVVTEA
jgi:hypothetical protein